MNEISALKPVVIQKISKIARDGKHRDQTQKRPKYQAKEEIPSRRRARLDEIV